ncbi:MAG: hypothetical protein AB1813_03735 [Verrucomicrobiota bacterium]
MKKNDRAPLGPTVHLEFIQNQADAPEPLGVEAVEAYHRALFLHHHARDLERFQQEAHVHEGRLAYLDGRLKEIQARLAERETLVPVDLDGTPDIKPTSPWNLWDRVMVCAAVLGIVVLLAFGILNISFNLLESGLVTFLENPVRAYFWAALLPVGALAVKIGWDILQCQRKRDVYLWCCLAAGIAGVLVWVAAYAAVYPTLSKSTSEQIESLSVFDDSNKGNPLHSLNAAGAKWIDVIIVASQAVAEIFLSAVLGMYVTMIYGRHRPVRLAGNPLFLQLEEERRALEEEVARERLALGEARGQESGLTHQMNALLSYAKSLYQKESALRRDQSHQKRLLLDQITEEIRTQLETVENGNRSATDRRVSSLNLSQQNGK